MGARRSREGGLSEGGEAGFGLRGGSEGSGRSTVLERLRQLILVGEYSPGERLVEERVAARLGVSRTPVRQALAMLEAEGLVEMTANKGAVVPSFSAEEVWDVYDLRAVLEGHAARRAAGGIREDELARLRDLAGEMEGVSPELSSDREAEVRRLVACNQEFHGTIVRASRNTRLEKLVGRTVQVPLVFKAFFWYGPEDRAISNHYHRQIVRALAVRDAERAEIIMREHVYEGRDFVIRALEEDRR